MSVVLLNVGFDLLRQLQRFDLPLTRHLPLAKVLIHQLIEQACHLQSIQFITRSPSLRHFFHNRKKR
ncbi:hypothetical protein D3C71_2133300 [compost metagenome]